MNLNPSKLKKHLNYEDQVREMIREMVISGEFGLGEKIPSSRKIAADLGTNSFTVHKALSALQSEGLLTRSVGKGSYVRKREEKLTCVGVYCGNLAQEMLYTSAVNSALKKELEAAGIKLDVWVDSRPESQHGEPWEPLVKAAEQRRFQAFIGTEVDLSLLRWQQKLPVPTTFLGGPLSLSNKVSGDVEQLVEISLRELARQGCRSVGLIAPIMNAHRFTYPDGSHDMWFNAMEHFTTVAADLDLTVKNEWIRVFHDRAPAGVRGQERFGYEEFLKLWSQPERPEGLLVLNDTVARGMLMALQEKHVRVPEELKLVLQKNESIDLFCPMPATFVVSSERDMARTLIEQVQKQFRGESCEPISLPNKLEPHLNPEK